jgi:hypothetical protein
MPRTPDLSLPYNKCTNCSYHTLVINSLFEETIPPEGHEISQIKILRCTSRRGKISFFIARYYTHTQDGTTQHDHLTRLCPGKCHLGRRIS